MRIEGCIHCMRYKILNTIGERYTEKATEALNQLGEVDYFDVTQDKLLEIIEKYDIAVIGLGLAFDKSVLEKAKNLKVIATATTGLDHIDTNHAQSRSIAILSLKGENEFLDTITGTAELACGLMMDLLRFTPQAFDSVKNYEWDREKFRGRTLHGKTLGIVGMGRLGKWMARYGDAFGMNVIFCDPYVEKSPLAGPKKVSFDELLERSDVISIHVPLNKETEGVFNRDVFLKMKNTVYVVNTSRGRVVNENDLLKALKRKEIAGYATDVLADELSFAEKGLANHPLIEYAKENNNVIIVPHLGGMTHESRERTDIFIAEKLRKYLK